MTFLWLFIWVCSNAPDVWGDGEPTSWGIALAVCVFIDVVN